jgi:crossover junction endodeoxyribonuclease RuvC
MTLMGIDPGVTGAIAFYEPGIKYTLAVYDMPADDQGDLDLGFILELMDMHRPDLCVMERVAAMTYIDGRGVRRGQGAAASFNFGMNYGKLFGLFAGRVDLITVAPAVWKAKLGLSRDKNKSREKAAQLFDSHTGLFKLKKHDGRAEAALLAFLGVSLRTVV